MTEGTTRPSQSTVLMDIFGKVEVVRSQQTEINRRLGTVEKKLDEVCRRQDKVIELEATVESIKDQLDDTISGKSKWRDWFWQAVMWVIGTTVVFAVASYFGIEMKT